MALLWQGTANARGDEQKSSEAGLVGRVRNTEQSPLTTIGQARSRRSCAERHVFTPGGPLRLVGRCN